MAGGKEAVRFLLGFLGMLSLGLFFLVAVGFYEVEFSGPSLPVKAEVSDVRR